MSAQNALRLAIYEGPELAPNQLTASVAVYWRYLDLLVPNPIQVAFSTLPLAFFRTGEPEGQGRM
jgi:hypothetical protein